jgi:hypothetical protein
MVHVLRRGTMWNIALHMPDISIGADISDYLQRAVTLGTNDQWNGCLMDKAA